MHSITTLYEGCHTHPRMLGFKHKIRAQHHNLTHTTDTQNEEVFR